MKISRIVIAVVATAAFCTLWPGNAGAQSWNRKTTLTFDQPVEIPNLVLPAGTYVFKRVDNINPNIVQISSADETHVYATLLTVPDYKPEAPADTVITFEERSSNSPKAIKDWFYPGDPVGDEFLYPAPQEHPDNSADR